MTKIKTLTCLLIIFSGNTSFSQSATNTHPFFVRINPTGLMDFWDTNISGGFEYKLNDKLGITLDGAWIFYSAYLRFSSNASGFIARPGLRYYLGRKNDYFFEFQLHYKQVKYATRDSLHRDVANGIAAYSEISDFEYKKQVGGYHFILGKKLEMNRSKRLFFEFYAGLGVHYRKGTLVNQPSNTEYYINNPSKYFDLDFNTGVLPVFPLGMRAVWRL